MKSGTTLKENEKGIRSNAESRETGKIRQEARKRKRIFLHLERHLYFVVGWREFALLEERRQEEEKEAEVAGRLVSRIF